jgi:hypothetical protein
LLLLPAGNFFGALYHKLQTQSSALEDGRKYCPKHVELIEITNKLLLLPAGNFFGALYHKLQTQSSAVEDGRNYCPKHVELIEITNKLLLLHLVGCLYYSVRDARSHRHQSG